MLNTTRNPNFLRSQLCSILPHILNCTLNIKAGNQPQNIDTNTNTNTNSNATINNIDAPLELLKQETIFHNNDNSAESEKETRKQNEFTMTKLSKK